MNDPAQIDASEHNGATPAPKSDAAQTANESAKSEQAMLLPEEGTYVAETPQAKKELGDGSASAYEPKHSGASAANSESGYEPKHGSVTETESEPEAEPEYEPGPEPEPDPNATTVSFAAAEVVEPTVARPLVSATTPSPQVETSSKEKPSKRFVAFLGRHWLAVTLIVAFVVVAIAILIVYGADVISVPDEEVVSADAKSRVTAPDYDGGSFGSEDVLTRRSITVREITSLEEALDEDENSADASAHASAEVLVVYQGSTVRAEVTTTLGYAYIDGEWVAEGEVTNEQIAWSALSGVDTDKVLENISIILARAERSLDEDSDDANELSLSEIYTSGDITITSETFDEDEQTDTLEISCVSESAYSSYSCEITVCFTFMAASGQWEVSTIEVSEGAKDISYAALEGTWTGTFQSQTLEDSSGAEGKCLAAQGASLELVIESASETSDGVEIIGTVSGIAHLHAAAESNSSSNDGDTSFTEVSFTATLIDEEENGSLTFEATLPEQVGGTVSLTICFGSSDDTSDITATVETTYPYTETFLFLTYDQTVTYTDSYVLRSAA